MVTEYDWPVCARCQRPVECLETEKNLRDNSITYVARCHGKVEIVRITEEDLMKNYIRFTRAFAHATPVLPERSS